MIAYLPAIYSDELVYSWFSRYYVHSGCFSHKEALQELYCKRSDYLSKEFIGNLNPDAMDQINKVYSLDELVLNHTMYPQYARFIPLEKKKEALYRLGHEPCDVHHLFSVLPRNERERYLRYCPMCAREDREIYGEAYWHRKHQIRNMSVCVKHKCKLMESNVLAKSEQCFIFSPAENYVNDDRVVIESDPVAIRFASYLDSVFDAPIDFENDVPISAVLYDGMSRTKYLKPSGRSRYTKMLAEDMDELYKSMGKSSVASIYQIQRALLGSRFDFMVICQIAFFLGMEIEELLNPTLTMEQIQKEKESHYMRDAVPVDWEQLDIEMAPVLEKFAKGVYDGTGNENGRPERVSEKRVYREMGLLGHQLENMPRCKAIMERYAESYPESWARKIIWAYQKLKENGEPFYWTDIRKIAGVKKKNFKAVVPYLMKHTDADTFNRIMALSGD